MTELERNTAENAAPPFRAPVPPQVRRELAEVVAPDEEFRLAVTTDIKLDGQYGEAWLMATADHLVAFSPDGGGPPDVVCLPLNEITGVEVREDWGTAALKVRTEERGATMAVFSKSLVPALSELPNQVERLVKQAQPTEPDGQMLHGRLAGARAGRKRCDRCGQVIPRYYGVCPACLEKGKLLFRLLSYAKPHWKLITFSLLLMVAATTIGLGQPLLMSVLIDDVLNVGAPSSTDVEVRFDLLALLPVAKDNPVAALAWLVGLLILMNLTVSVLSALRGYIMARIGQRVTYGLRNEVYTHLHALSLSYYNKNETGRIMASVTQDVGRLQDFISDGLQEAIRDVLTLIIICIILFGLNPGLAALVLLPTPLLVWATMRFGRKLHAIYRPLWRRWASLSALLADTIPGVRVVKAFAQEQREVGKFEGRSLDLLRGELRVAWMRSLFGPVMTFVTAIGTIIIWWVGGRDILSGELTLGAFVAFTMYMYRFYGPVESLCRLNHRFQRAATSAERVFDVLDTHPEVIDQPGAMLMPPIEGRVEFRGVHFGYEEDKPVIEDLNFHRRAGRDDRPSWPQRRGQEHPNQPHLPLLRAAGGSHPHRRPRHPPSEPPIAARADRRGLAGSLPLQRHGRRQHRLRPSRVFPRTDRSRGQGRQCARLHHEHARRVRHHGRRARHPRIRRRAAAAVHCPGHFAQPAHSHSRRSHLQRRYPNRSADSGGVGAAGPRAHHLCHCPSLIHPQKRPPPTHPRQGQTRRDRHPRRVDRARRHLRQPVPHANRNV